VNNTRKSGWIFWTALSKMMTIWFGGYTPSSESEPYGCCPYFILLLDLISLLNEMARDQSPVPVLITPQTSLESVRHIQFPYSILTCNYLCQVPSSLNFLRKYLFLTCLKTCYEILGSRCLVLAAIKVIVVVKLWNHHGPVSVNVFTRWLAVLETRKITAANMDHFSNWQTKNVESFTELGDPTLRFVSIPRPM
jgi:hypothetical protein